jgi:hypothetical protein
MGAAMPCGGAIAIGGDSIMMNIQGLNLPKNSFKLSIANRFLSYGLVLLFVMASACFMQGQTSAVSYNSLSEGKVIHGFKTVTVYLNADDKPMGARFVHVATGFTLDLLQIQSVPQAMIAVNTFPDSDRGEPHTQEHLLIAKGNKGRGLQNFELMSLVADQAFTNSLQTVYHINTIAGPDTFYLALEKTLDALIHPDYTEEEVRREVRNFGYLAMTLVKVSSWLKKARFITR